jgi:hypothetical protein
VIVYCGTFKRFITRLINLNRFPDLFYESKILLEELGSRWAENDGNLRLGVHAYV